MASTNKKIYAFGKFRLDPAENLLLKGDVPIALKPKEFSALVCLVENHGTLVERSTLMDRLWGDSFVEEGAISKCIWAVRNALGDDSKTQSIIQTVPKRGYRFVSEISEIYITSADEAVISRNLGEERGVDENTEQLIDHKLFKDRSLNRYLFRRLVIPAFVLILVAISTLSIGSYYALRENVLAPILTRPFDIQFLSRDGSVDAVILSPDGDMVYYVKSLGGRKSIRARSILDGNENEIVPAAKIDYGGLGITTDGRTLFFTRGNAGRTPFDLFRISATGGIPVKLVEDVQGWIGVSPDGNKISYVRCLYKEDDYCSLNVADSGTGENEYLLVTRHVRSRIGANTFDRDGKSIIFTYGQSHTATNGFHLSKVDIATGVETKVTHESFFNIKNLAWIEGSGHLLMTATKAPGHSADIWKVNVNSGEVARVSSRGTIKSHQSGQYRIDRGYDQIVGRFSASSL